MSTQHLFAKAHDNVAGLVALHTLTPPLFGRYMLDMQTEWHSEGEIVLDANLAAVPIGPPWVVFVLQAITNAEWLLLRSTLWDGQAKSGPVTIQTLNKDLNTYLPYNGTAYDPEKEPGLGGWKNVRLTVSELELISGFSAGFDELAFGV